MENQVLAVHCSSEVMRDCSDPADLKVQAGKRCRRDQKCEEGIVWLWSKLFLRGQKPFLQAGQIFSRCFYFCFRRSVHFHFTAANGVRRNFGFSDLMEFSGVCLTTGDNLTENWSM